MPRLLEKEDLQRIRFRSVPVSSLIAPPISAEKLHLMGLETSSLTAPAQLSVAAIQAATMAQPILVVRNGADFEAVGNLRTFALAQLLSSDQKVGVLELRGALAGVNHLARIAAFLTTSVSALDPQTANQQFLRTWHLTPQKICKRISPWLCSRSRLRQLLSIRRRDQLNSLAPLRSDFAQLLDQFGGNS